MNKIHAVTVNRHSYGLLPLFQRVINERAKKLKNFTAPALDGILPEILKYAPPTLHDLLALYTADCHYSVYFPAETNLGIISWLWKRKNSPSSLTNYRPIRNTSCPGKLVSHAAVAPVFPPSCYDPNICPEQIAGRKGHSADMAALIITLTIQLRRNQPTVLMLMDISSAFDETWREALWRKILLMHGNTGNVAALNALDGKLRSHVKMSDGNSEVMEFLSGIGQGDPNSTTFYTFFLSDLPAELRQAPDTV
jgi:hypothetical protein